MILQINPRYPSPAKIQKALNVLKQQGLLAYPTDTIYGIGCDLYNKKGIEKLYQLKNMNKKKPLAFICPDLSEISKYAIITDQAYRLMKRLLPGPYTFVLEATKLVPKILVTKRRTVGIRVPQSPICQSLVQGLGNPIVTTSAVIGKRVLQDADEIKAYLGHAIQLIIDGGRGGLEPSTVISLIDDRIEILRKGVGPLDF
jgi:tRNA threonylcarbamoyl adenosine modification protein (Sua5/YciO/YrdC/YwlC family)